MWTEFYQNNIDPEKYVDELEKIERFTKFHKNANHHIAFLTSGATKVPIENRTVRYMDNFSSGKRGSISAEFFLEEGYPIIFLHRKGSLCPFHRIFSDIHFLDHFEKSSSGEIKVKAVCEAKFKEIFDVYENVTRNNQLLMIEYVTLADYLYYLKEISIRLRPFKGDALVYLAAAVSDFYIPSEDMPEHKIQSAEGTPELNFKNVPKMLEPLTHEWVTEAYIITFKLETDPEILSRKAYSALEKYKHQAVIGNILETREKEIHLITPSENEVITMSDEELKKKTPIERQIVTAVTKKHSSFKNKS